MKRHYIRRCNQAVELTMDFSTIFQHPEYEAENWKYIDDSIQPKFTPDESASSIDFKIGGQTDPAVTLLNTLMLCGSVQVLKEDGSAIPDGELVSTCNLFPHALFEDVVVRMQHLQVSDSGRNYHLKSYITHNYSYGAGSKKLRLKTDCYEPDGEGDDITLGANPGAGFFARMDKIKKSKKVFFAIKPIIDLASSPSVLAPGLEMDISFVKSKASVPLIGKKGSNYQLKFSDVRLECRRVNLEQGNPVLDRINNAKLYYPINRSHARIRPIPVGSQNVDICSIVDGQLPYHIIACFVTNGQLMDINNNPYMFKTHNLRSYQLQVNSQGYPARQLDVSGANANKGRSYKYFLDQMGVNAVAGDCGPDFDDYFENSFVMAWNLSLDHCCGIHSHKSGTGKINLHLEFEQATPYQINTFILCLYENSITIDKGKTILDYSC